jgi:hypothetical protein
MNRRSSQTARDLAESVSRFLASFEADKVPPGWYTTLTMAPLLGIKDRQAYNIAARFVAAGQAEKKNFRIKVGCYIRPVPHYRFTTAAAKALGLTKPRR